MAANIRLVTIPGAGVPDVVVETSGQDVQPEIQKSVLPEKDFDDVLLFVAETEIAKEGNPLSALLVSDPSFEFLRNVMEESEDAIKEEVGNAINFFKSQFGIDVSSFEKKGDAWVSGEHKFMSHYVSPTVGYRPYFTKTKCLASGEVLSGGFEVFVGHPGIMAKGKYGGETGKIIPAGSILVFGYYKIKFNDGTNRIMHYRSPGPLMSDLTTVFPIDCDIYDFELKMWGRAVGTSSTYDAQDTRHISIRNTLTFPGGLR